jgi:AbrB family looped-hinge helix DNA binding protein
MIQLVPPMDPVTVSRKFQVVIPLAVRQALGLQPGVKMQVVHYQDRVEFIPVRPAKALRGSLRGISTEVPRDADRT